MQLSVRCQARRGTATNNFASVTASGITLQPAVARSVAWNSTWQTSQWSRAPPSPTNTRSERAVPPLNWRSSIRALAKQGQRSQLPASLPRSWQIPRKCGLRKMDLVCKRLQLNWTRAELSADWTCGRCNQQAPRTDGSGDSDASARNSLWCPLPNNVENKHRCREQLLLCPCDRLLQPVRLN